jgi:hypothetical protein
MLNDDSFKNEGKMNGKLDNDELIKEEVSKTIDCLNNMPILTADSGFYNRFADRIASGEGKRLGLIARILIGYHLAHILLLVIIVANLATAFLIFRDAEALSGRDQYIEYLADQCLPDVTSPLSIINDEK